MKKVSAVVIGAGQRGMNYSNYALDFPDRLEIVGVAEPRKFYREKIQKQHKIPEDRVYLSWEDAAAVDKFADCVFITTQDRMHRDPAVAFANKGYNILLEKPMAVTYKDCCDIVETSRKNGVMLAVCHVMRYMPQSKTIKRLIDSGSIGEVINIQHLEPVGYYHFAHSYVRGNWRNTQTSNFSLMTKCCHDLDLIDYWMGNVRCQAVSSMGSLKHFKPENKPKGAGSRCLDCSCEPSCPYSAKKIYLDNVKRGNFVRVITEVPDIESVTEVLKNGPYGRCVYECDNDVMDNQVVTMQYDGGATCTMSMVACTEKLCARQTRVFGSKGELTCDFDTTKVRQFDFLTENVTVHDVMDDLKDAQGSSLMGHGGADFFAMHAFVNAISMNDPTKIMTGAEESLRSHYLCFAAEKARLDKSVVDVSKETEVD